MWPDSFFSKHEVLPDNYQFKTYEIYNVKLLLRSLALFLFKWSLRFGLFLPFLRFTLLTLLPFLFNSGLSAQILLTSNFSDFNSESKSVGVFAIFSRDAFQLRTFVWTWNTKWFGFTRFKDFIESAIQWVVAPWMVLKKTFFALCFKIFGFIPSVSVLDHIVS